MGRLHIAIAWFFLVVWQGLRPACWLVFVGLAGSSTDFLDFDDFRNFFNVLKENSVIAMS